MKDYITAFFMCWGNFLTIPCPLKLWDSKMRYAMLGFLPAVGLIVGGLWYALYRLLSIPEAFPLMGKAFILAAFPYLISGFMHLDGFVDCCDAMLSRKPLEDKLRILKDSTVGALGVAAMIMMILAQFAFMYSCLASDINMAFLILLPVISRSFSGLEILTGKSLGHSQYASSSPDTGSSEKEKLPVAERKSTARYMVIALLLLIVIGTVVVFNDIELIPLFFVVVASRLTLFHGIHQFGGMSGDIAGYSIVWTEMAGLLLYSLLPCGFAAFM